MKSFVIIASLGTLRAFRTVQGDDGEPEHLEELEVSPPPPTPEPIREQVSDHAGRFPAGNESGVAGMRQGEHHHKGQESVRRHIKALAEMIEQLVRSGGYELWRMAAPSEINGRLVASLSEPLRARLLLNLHADLTKLPLRDVEARFIGTRRTASGQTAEREP